MRSLQADLTDALCNNIALTVSELIDLLVMDDHTFDNHIEDVIVVDGLELLTTGLGLGRLLSNSSILFDMTHGFEKLFLERIVCIRILSWT